MSLFDVHAHLTHPELLPDVDAILSRASAARVTTIVSNGLNPEDNQRVAALSQRDARVRPAFGLYPVDAVLASMRAAGVPYPGDQPAVSAEVGVGWVASHIEEAFAVGEIGLDGHWVPEAFWGEQEAVFVALVQLAMRADKPVIIHTRKRERRALELLDELGARRVNWHCYTSRLKLAREIASRGHYMSIPANVRRSETFTRMLQTLPRSQLLLETDCPYLAPERGERSEPSNVASSLAFASELWGEPPQAVESQLSENFQALFGVEP